MGKTINEGDYIGKNFEALRILGGEGVSGRGNIYVCKDHGKIGKNKIVVLKTLQDKFLKDKKYINEFRREALAWIQLEKHPYIVKAKNVINIEDRPYIVLEYVAPDEKNRNTLEHYMKEPIPTKQAIKWSIQICYAMEYANSQGISAHRDINPKNIMITVDGNVKLTDFGLVSFEKEEQNISNWNAKADSGTPGFSFIRDEGETFIGGTLCWMSPEHFGGITDIRSDIYSFGVVLYQIENKGIPPFNYKKISDYYYAHHKKPIKVLDSVLFPIIQRCLKKDPNDRYQDFKKLRLDLEELYQKISGEKHPTPPQKDILTSIDHFNKGVSYYSLNFFDDAIKELKEAIRMRHDYSDAYIKIGRIYQKLGNLDDAISFFKDAIKHEPFSIEAHRNLGKTYKLKELFSESLSEYHKITQLDSHYVIGHYKLGKAYETIGDYDLAILTLKNFVNNAPPEYNHYIKKAKRLITQLKKKRK